MVLFKPFLVFIWINVKNISIKRPVFEGVSVINKPVKIDHVTSILAYIPNKESLTRKLIVTFSPGDVICKHWARGKQ